MKLLYRITVIMVVVLFASCSTTEKFYVSGTPNTKIYTPAHKHVGTIGSNGTAKIELSSDHYYAFLLSKDAESDTYIPFALDYINKDREGEETLYASLIGVSAIAAGSAIAATTDNLGTILGAALGPGILGGGALGIASARSAQTSYVYRFKYLNNQTTNSDLNFTKAVFTEPYKNVEQVNLQNEISTSAAVAETSISRKQLSEKSAKTLKNYGKDVAKVYVGTGKLTQGKTTIESYSGIKVRIEYVNRNEVRVNVTESNGSDFFTNYSLYKVEKKNNGSYLLTHSKIASATITIDSRGNLKYSHPKVDIDGDVYELNITTK